MFKQMLQPRRLLIVFGAIVSLGAAYYTGHRWFELSDSERLADARVAWVNEEFLIAHTRALGVLQNTPDSADALSIAGQAALQLGRCGEAEELLGRALRVSPGDSAARLCLVRLLRSQGRFFELLSHALELLRSGDSGNEYLLALAAPDELRLSGIERELAASCRTAVPDDTLSTLGLARHYVQTSRFRQAVSLLEKIVIEQPQQTEAQALLGTALLEIEDEAAFLRWHQRLPVGAGKHPEIWFLRGIWSRANQQPEAAIRCFCESIQRDPNHRRAHYQLTQTMTVAGESSGALDGHAWAAERFQLLEEVSRLATKGNDDSAGQLNAGTMYDIACLMESLGRMWEAASWFRKAIALDDQIAGAKQRLDNVSRQLNQDTPLTLLTFNPVSQIDLAQFPLPNWPADVSPTRTTDSEDPPHTTVAFSDDAASSGLVFRHYNDAQPERGRARMFDFSGGGVAVLDYDGDLWPDVYLTQGCEWPPQSGRTEHRDRLFRNVNGERFEDVTDESGLGDEHYSQGVAAGDFDNDGYADLYLANIGSNRLYHNNGDGTFADVTASTAIGGDEWTVSCVLADLNGDSLPDIYAVNYLSGPDVYDRQCRRDGLPVQCPLHYFRSAQDRLYLNLGNGAFEEATEETGIVLPEGKGMGIVAGAFEPNERNSLFIANDDKPNFFLVSDGNGDHGTPRFSERGAISGLAFDDRGAVQSCMGVAAGDINNDGLLDLYVTNFTNEHNNLYVQRSAHTFEDRARAAGLRSPTVRQMGWGAQFLDADLDGLLDLLIANGHLDENTSGPEPYRMPTQFFRNLGKDRFAETSMDKAGGYFARSHVGRAVARLDWNRDGRPDACITHVDSPVALLTNRTSGSWHFLTLRLRGVDSSRNATGSVIRVTSGDRVTVRHLTAGDGFMASNERKTIFGLGDSERVDELTVHWPSGLEQVIHDLPLETEFILVEGQPPVAVEINGR